MPSNVPSVLAFENSGNPLVTSSPPSVNENHFLPASHQLSTTGIHPSASGLQSTTSQVSLLEWPRSPSAMLLVTGSRGTLDNDCYLLALTPLPHHNNEVTTFSPPSALRPSNLDIGQPGSPFSSSTGPQSPSSPSSPQNSTLSRDNFKRGSAKQRSVKAPSAKRNPDSQVVKRGWLHRLESSGLSKSKAWKQRWCVLADFALFLYKTDGESQALTSILLPSYRINPCTQEDGIKRNFVFKVEHENTKTLYFATEDSSEFASWVSLLRQAASMNGTAGFLREPNNNQRPPFIKGRDDSRMAGGPQFSNTGGPASYGGEHPRSSMGPNPPGREGPPPGSDRNGNIPRGGQQPHATQSPSYQGYGDPAASPLEGPNDFSRGYGNPGYSGGGPVDPQRRSVASNPGGSARNSMANASQRGSQAYPSPSSNQDYSPDSFQPHSLNAYQPQSQNNGHGPPGHHGANSGYDPEGYGSNAGLKDYRDPQNPQHRQHHQQPPLRDGFAPDSARNSFAPSDSSRGGQHSYHPAQVERERIQQRLGHPPADRYPGPDTSRGDPNRDSYSDYQDGSPKQLNPWDKNFPPNVLDQMKHRSFIDLADNQRGRQPGKDRTFNARSKSHENFSHFPDSQQQQEQQQQRQQHPQAGNTERDGYGQMPQGDGQFPPPGGRQSWAKENRHPGSPAGSQRSSNQYSPGHGAAPLQQHNRQPRREDFQYSSAPRLDARGPGGYPSPHDLNDRNSSHHQPYGSGQYPQGHGHPQQDRRSYASASSSVGGREGYGHSPSSSSHPAGPPSHQEAASPMSRSSSNPMYSGFPQQHHDSRQQHFAPQRAGQQDSAYPPPQQQVPHLPLDLNASQMSSSHTPPQSGHHSNPHTYVNFPSRDQGQQYPQQQGQGHNTSHDSSGDPSPGRPPYPVAVRQQLVEEMAQNKPPTAQRDLLIATQMNAQRMQQPSYFQYPSPRDQYGNRIPQGMDQADNASLRNPPYQDSPKDHRRDLPNSRLSSASRASQSSRGGDRKDSPQSPPDSFTRDMMDPEAQKLRVAYERVHSLRMAPDKAPPKRKPAPIQTVKEDPNMSDREILETNLQKIQKKNPLSGPRLRMSISAGDLIGKTHDELVLLLIQLRRNQAALEKTRDFYRSQTEHKRAAELEYRKQVHQYGEVQDRRLYEQHQAYVDARMQMEEVENKLEVYRPIINLLDNMVTMGSLYGGDNLMLATQYRKHLLRPDQYQPPKKMLEFSRQHQEDRLIQETQEEIKQLSSDEVDLEEKIDRLNELDRLLQEQSFKVSSFKQDKELMEKALNGVLKQQEQNPNDPREMRWLGQQQRILEKEISRVTQQLAEASKELEETTAQNNKLEHEVALLRTKVHGELTRSRSAPSLASENARTKMKMEKELAKVEGIMQGLNKEGARLSQAMNTLRRSSSGSQLAAALDREEAERKTGGGTYLQTDLDSGEQIDLAGMLEAGSVEGDNSMPIINHQRQNASASEDWDMDGADENTKRFFGLMPRDKPKGQTVRDVKRQAEQRKEREKHSRRDDEEFGEEIKLRVSNVDNEVSSIIHARIPVNSSLNNNHATAAPGGQFENSAHPLYENLPRYGSVPALPDSQSASSSRRSSIILMAPKPFTPYQDKSSRPFRSELALNTDPDSRFGAGDVMTKPDSNLDRNYRSEEILNDNSDGFMNSQVGKDKEEINPYVNENPYMRSAYESDLPLNSFGSAHQLSSGEFHAKPFFAHQRAVSDLGGVSDPMMTSTVANDVYSSHNTGLDSGSASTKVNNLDNGHSRAYVPRPWSKPSAEIDSDLFNMKRNSRGRFPTISSSQPVKMEGSSFMHPTLHSTAGDLILNRSIDDVPDIVKSSQTHVDGIDEDTIDREILYVPDKVLIPERYDAEADAEQLTAEDEARRQEKAEKIKRLLTSQSVLSMSQPDISQLESGEVHSRVQQEKKERAHFLALSQQLAKQVTQQTKKQAAERRKTWSGGQFAEIKRQYDEEMANSPSSPLRSPDSVRQRAGITLHSLT
ncbi:uncharacterized protein LOC101852180 [Aplysia californica]|uniref:Uncharacterized protein LOC101852180 n=1 Tax=Aplysia californica TaxID=6500 RepID=A0ABM0JR03_APLCA|nr:uncharacterized protein LOC101852180 [Aplysia californica]